MPEEIFEVTRERFHLLDRNQYIVQGSWPKDAKMEAYLDGHKLKTTVKKVEMVSALERFKDPDLMRGEQITATLEIPDSLEESAQLDGAGYTTIFLKIYCPLCKPVFATVALFVAVGQWNSWFDAMLYNRMNSDLTTLQYELMKLLSSVTNQGTSAEAMKNAVGTVTPTSVRSAATILTMLPIICIYPFLQKYFVTGLTLGGVKE